MAALRKLAPLFDRVLVEKMLAPATSRAGVILPESVMSASSGVVVATGERQLDNGKTVPLTVKEGDKVLLPEFGGKDIVLGGKEYILYQEEELLGILQEDPTSEQ